MQVFWRKKRWVEGQAVKMLGFGRPQPNLRLLWGRALRLYITNPVIRQSIKEQFDVPPEVFQYLGYGLFAGKK